MDRYGLSLTALDDARAEMLDHETFVEMESTHPIWLPMPRVRTH
jgi:hypothetical protein